MRIVACGKSSGNTAAETLDRCFLIQVPIVLILFSIAAWGLPSSRFDPASTTSTKFSYADFLGLITFILTMTTFLLITSLGERRFPWHHPVILSLIAACLIFGLFFVLIQGLIAERPLIPLRLLRSHNVGVFCWVQILLFIARMAVSMPLPSRLTKLI